MLSLSGSASEISGHRAARREFMYLGGLGIGGLSLATLLRQEARAEPRGGSPRRETKAKSCILIFMDGGPSHLEMWDVKPDAPVDIRGEFKTIPSSQPGVRVGELLPLTSKQMHQFAQVRSVHHPVTDHNAGSYYMLTGKSPSEGSRLIVTDSATTFPGFGAVLAKSKPVDKPVPPSVLVPEYQWNNGVDVAGQKAGFLGAGLNPFIGGDPSLPGYQIPGLDLAADLPLDRMNERDELRKQLDRALGSLGESSSLNRIDQLQQRAFEVITSTNTRAAFDLSREPHKLRARYGLDPGSDRSIEARKFGGLPHLGQCMLLARRLVEAGVRLVTVMTGRRIDQAWDTHRDHFGLMRKSLCPPFDQALSALMSDLADRGLLDETLVVVMGEFGRTPKIGYVTSNAGASKNGRDHWPYCYTVLFAGGGVPGGTIIGSSDRIAAYPNENPVTPEDIAATLYQRMGVDPQSELRDGQDRPYTLSTGKPIVGLV
jgi:hypothetical protein